MKLIITHLSPDLDAFCAIWLIKRFLPGWKNAEIKYVPAGKTLDGEKPDALPDVIHVDTGLGQFDHHQENNNTCSAKLVSDFLINKNHLAKKDQETIVRIVEHVNEIDHFLQVNYPDPAADHWDFLIHQIIEGLKSTQKDKKNLEAIVLALLDSEFQILKNKVVAEAEIKKGFIFQSYWGKSIVMETKNSEALNLALKMNFDLAAKKDPQYGNIRIKIRPERPDLTPLYQEVIKIDPKATWFFHVSKKMLLNGSAKAPHFVPSSLSVKRLIELIKKI